MRRILITGGQGYIGGRLAEYLSKDSNNSIVVTSRSPKNHFNPRISSIKVNPKTDNLVSILHDYSTIIHLAALDAQSCVSNPYEAIDVNISDTLRWRMAAETAMVKEFIYFSTIHVYGNSTEYMLDEFSNTFPIHPYAITHKSAEEYVLSPIYNKKSKAIVFRLSDAFGKPEGDIMQWQLVVLDFCKQAVENNKIIINSNSSQLRDFICISDVCEGVQFAFENAIDSGIYNLSSGMNKTLLEVAESIKRIAFERYNQTIEIVEKVSRVNVCQPLISNNKYINWGFKPANKMDEGLGDLLDFCFTMFRAKW